MGRFNNEEKNSIINPNPTPVASMGPPMLMDPHPVQQHSCLQSLLPNCANN